MSDEQVDDYLCHVLASFLCYVIEAQPGKPKNWALITDAQRTIWALTLAHSFMQEYNAAKLAVLRESA